MYFIHIELQNYRSAITRLINGAHKLNIETGRFSNKATRVEHDKKFCDFVAQASNVLTRKYAIYLIVK